MIALKEDIGEPRSIHFRQRHRPHLLLAGPIGSQLSLISHNDADKTLPMGGSPWGKAFSIYPTLFLRHTNIRRRWVVF